MKEVEEGWREEEDEGCRKDEEWSLEGGEREC